MIPFCFCIALIILIWHQHFVFYFRYGLRNGTVLLLNTLFLIIVLFYVYPLKFLTKLILWPVAYIFNQDEIMVELNKTYAGTDMAYLMVIYGIGATSFFAVLMLMYRYALKNAALLQLNEIEEFDTKASMHANFLMGKCLGECFLASPISYTSLSCRFSAGTSKSGERYCLRK